ncbi:histidine phosphatase family protein [Bacillus andreraoultii]|uniref:histidine phosphatase family protein n=1 Tax=Bacillus andreraoultii TaxID=1499685 RepID=UPI00053B05C3|nr:histidine phosphatase family protein [Bacillus andreraoultii]
MVRLYIVRHGETEWNQEGRMQGSFDSKLTEKGKRYARLLSERLKPISFSKMICSPSKRAVDTAKILNSDCNGKIMLDERIVEMKMGRWQGMTEEEIQLQFYEDYKKYIDQPELYRNDDGETFQDVLARVKGFLMDIQSEPDDGNILIVTHGSFIQILLILLKGKRLTEVWTEPIVEGTSLTRIDIYQKKIHMICIGDMSHVRICDKK